MNLQEQISRIQSMMGLITESNFKLGDSDDKIEDIQGVLKLEKTGSFNEPTEKCVKEFQTFTNIKIDGIVRFWRVHSFFKKIDNNFTKHVHRLIRVSDSLTPYGETVKIFFMDKKEGNFHT